MLFSSGKATGKKAAPKRKPAPKKAAAPKRKPAPKPAARKVAPKRTVTSGGSRLMGGAAKTSGAENFAKNLFSEKNWAYQAFSILRELPEKNKNPSKGKATNNRTGF